MTSLERTQSRLDNYYAAEEAILSGQSYKMGTFSLTRADLGRVQEAIAQLEREVSEKKSKNHGKRCAFRVTPRDL